MKLSSPAPDEQIDLSHTNLLDPHFFATGDPHAVWYHLRHHTPIYAQRSPQGQKFWSITRYHDVCRVLKDYNTFTSQQGTMLCILNKPDIAAGMMLAATDPPRHGEMRKPLERALSPAALQLHASKVEGLITELLSPGLSGEIWDFAEAAQMFPMALSGVLMGIPQADWKSLARLTTMSVAYEDPEFAEGSPSETLSLAHHELLAYFASEIALRRKTGPGDDLMGQLMTMKAGGDRFTDHEIFFNCYGLLLGANVTTPHAASATVLAMAEDPDAYRRWVSSKGLLASGVEEGLRWSSPANHFMRYAARDVEMNGVMIRRGEAVVVWLGSANRDEQVFDNPYQFDVGRHPNRHIAFGFGTHFCIGASLARMALRVLFSEILRRVEAIELAGPVAHMVSNTVAGIKHLNVRMIPRKTPLPRGT